MFLMNYTRPDIAYDVSRLSRYTHNPSGEHWIALKCLLKYLKGTVDWKLEFVGFPAVLEGYCDANWVSDNDEVSSTSGYVFTLGGATISWKSSKQTCIARSIMESEFIALDLAGQEAKWLRSLLADIPLWGRPTPPVSLLCDSQAAICVAKNQAYNVEKEPSRFTYQRVKSEAGLRFIEGMGLKPIVERRAIPPSPLRFRVYGIRSDRVNLGGRSACCSDYTHRGEFVSKAVLFEFADEHKKTFDGECPFYCSFSGFLDELSWAAAWLYTAIHSDTYFKYIKEETVPAVVDEFNWDLKYAGVQVLLSKEHADSYICAALPKSPYRRIPMTPGGLIHLRDGANLQYVTGASFLFSIYGDLLRKFNQKIDCGGKPFESNHVLDFTKQQMDYILGQNPRGRSYMVGFGKNPPTQAHHRGASVPLSEAKTDVNCGMSFARWFNKNAPNPNELTGAILGGPDMQDKFSDLRWTSVYTEPCT
ncbi:Endoglucanase 16 [Hibiscus syriacus]|uniref:Endoglucanase n=1 Tax=Hibiscus syriacus TaxID=106335 RepID=A0A6A2ZB77_HIBSY|nr:Endoglucanase 16 [Hibiscus syriacus]